MAIPAAFRSREEAPEAIREHLAEKGGLFVLDVEPFEDGGARLALEDVSALRNALDSEKKQRRSLSTRLEKAEADLTAARGRLQELEDDPGGAGGGDGGTNPEVAALTKRLARLEERSKADVAERDEVISKLRQRTHDAAVRDRVAELLAPHKGDVDLLLPHARSHLAAAEDGDDVRVGMSDSSQFRTEDELVSHLKSRYASGFAGSGATGAGARTPGSGGGADAVSNVLKQKSPVNRLTAAREAAGRNGTAR